MEVRARILLIISISSLILYLSVEGLNILPSIGQPIPRLDVVNQLQKNQDFPVLNEQKEASQLPNPPTALDDAKRAPDPINVESEGQVSSSPAPSHVTNPSFLPGSGSGLVPSQFSRPVPYPNPPPTFLGVGLGPALEPLPSSEPVPYPNPPSTLPGLGPGPTLKPLPSLGPVPYPNPPSILPVLGPGPDLKPLPSLGPVPYPNPPPSTLHGLGPGPTLEPLPSFGPIPYPNPPSTLPGLGPSSALEPLPSLGPVPDPNPPSHSFGLGPGPTPFGFYDHDVALAIEARIKQSQSDAQLAMDEAKKLLNDPNIASSETGKCLSKCMDKYTASLDKLNRAITDIGVHDVTLLSDDFGAVETDISTCQTCFMENIGDDSPLKALEEATTKAARECLTVLDYAA